MVGDHEVGIGERDQVAPCAQHRGQPGRIGETEMDQHLGETLRRMRRFGWRLQPHRRLQQRNAVRSEHRFGAPKLAQRRDDGVAPGTQRERHGQEVADVAEVLAQLPAIENSRHRCAHRLPRPILALRQGIYRNCLCFLPLTLWL